MLALSKLVENADCVFPVDNQSLIDITNKMNYNPKNPTALRADPEPSLVKTKKSKPFDNMNNIAAHLLLNLTRYMPVTLSYC